ncbi:hypothetical protein AB0C52_12730 [Streptomyces sp. NPDC048717]|uniref:hypothetical protein n=1 Tax=Streptomyces sp. NPDC048717 TaxID=3154928 RepID=UPI0034358083
MFPNESTDEDQFPEEFPDPDQFPDVLPELTVYLNAAGIPTFYDVEENLLFAHGPTVSRARARYSEHVTIGTRYMQPGYCAAAYVPDSPPDYHKIATVYDDPNPDMRECAKAVIDWFTRPRISAGGVLMAALSKRSIPVCTDDLGLSYAVPLDPATPAAEIFQRPHIAIGDRNPSIDHPADTHTGWIVQLVDRDNEPIGPPLFKGSDWVDCEADSAAAADVIARLLYRPTT